MTSSSFDRDFDDLKGQTEVVKAEVAAIRARTLPGPLWLKAIGMVLAVAIFAGLGAGLVANSRAINQIKGGGTCGAGLLMFDSDTRASLPRDAVAVGCDNIDDAYTVHDDILRAALDMGWEPDDSPPLTVPEPGG